MDRLARAAKERERRERERTLKETQLAAQLEAEEKKRRAVEEISRNVRHELAGEY
jgi:hypothetical protein